MNVMKTFALTIDRLQTAANKADLAHRAMQGQDREAAFRAIQQARSAIDDARSGANLLGGANFVGANMPAVQSLIDGAITDIGRSSSQLAIAMQRGVNLGDLRSRLAAQAALGATANQARAALLNFDAARGLTYQP